MTLNSRSVFVMRAVAGFVAAAHIFGLVMFLSSVEYLNFLVPIALLLVSVTRRIPLIILSAGFVVAGYVATGIPFMNPSIEIDLRAMHAMELILFVILATIGFRRAIREMLP
jgi:hypothetical protein